jgi:5-methylcytosine-specific restriction endonuclease McrA
VRRVYERDGWTCGICLKRINKRAKYPNPLSPSLDHIIPMSRGGGHQYVNVQAAHLRCNIEKGKQSKGEQLLLIG